MRRAAKRDRVEQQIVAVLRAGGFSVEFLSLTDGPDLLVGKHGVTGLLEVKTGRKGLRPGQQQWHAEWRGDPVKVVRTVEDATALMQSWARRENVQIS